jgi:hypothetical protein
MVVEPDHDEQRIQVCEINGIAGISNGRRWVAATSARSCSHRTLRVIKCAQRVRIDKADDIGEELLDVNRR